MRDTRTAALACFPHSVEYEAALVELERSTGGIVVQRRVDGSLRLCSSDGVIVWVGHRWRFTPNSARFADVIAHLVPQADRGVLVGLLDLCVHWLSAGRVGATLVWYLVEGSATVGVSLAGLDVSRAIQAPPLSLLERTHRPALLSALAQLDRAVLVQPTGRLTHLNVGLVPSPAAVTTVPAIRGTRHTSARRFSFDEPRAVVAVVSQDGGVTVFSDGAPIELARTVPTGRSALVDHQRPSVESVTQCPGCDRAILVEDTGPATGGSGTVTCPVCASPISAAGGGVRQPESGRSSDDAYMAGWGLQRRPLHLQVQARQPEGEGAPRGRHRVAHGLGELPEEAGVQHAARLVAEGTAGAAVPVVVDRVPQVARSVGCRALGCLLAVDRADRHEARQELGEGPRPGDHEPGPGAEHFLPAALECRLQDRLGGQLRLVHGRDRPRFSGELVEDHSNCGVFTAGSSTIAMRTLLPSASSSARTDSKNPRQANLAPQ